jgi:hypothetical protein
MRYFIKSILLFIPACSLTYILLICIWGELVPATFRTNLVVENRYENTSMRLHDVKDYKDIDILFLGSSRAYSGFDTRLYESMGYSAFNLGTSSQTPVQTKVLLKRYLDVLNPELIIYEVSPSMFSSDGVESSTDIIANGKWDLHAIKMGFNTRHLKVLNTLIFRIYTQTFKRGKEASPEDPDYDKRYIKGGFLESDQMEFKAIKLASFPQIEKMNNDQVIAFETILDMINPRHSQVILLQVPFTPSKYESHQAINPVFDHQMEQYGAYYNLNETMHLVDTIHFRDELHLNLDGVKEVNERIINMLNL